MFNNSSHVDASNSTFSEVHRDQYFNSQSTVQGNQTINTIVYGNQIHEDSHANLIEALQKASAPSAAHDSAQRFPAPKCIEGTRVELLERLTSWADDPDQKPMCWLNGRPGSGKSAVSQTIAETYADKKRLAASFFFSRRDLERRTTQHVVPTLTMQLLTSLPSIRPAVISALENDYMIPMKVLREQMEKLLLAPVSTVTEAPNAPLLIVIDALDECDDENSILELVSLLSLLAQKTPLPLRLLITSRSDPWLQSRFHRPDIAALTLSLEIHAFSAEADIRSFLRRALDDMYDEHLQVMKDIPRPWPPSDELDRIVNKAGGLFIFALTVVKFVGDKMHNPVERLQAILGDKDTVPTGSAYADLDSLYRDAISIFPDPDVARLVLGIVYCMATPISIPALHKLLKRPDVDPRVIVPALSSVLLASEDGKQPIQFYHASFRDFLTNPQRSRKYAIDPDAYDRLMAQLCLETMSNSLKRDMCGIGDPTRANNEVPDLAERREAAFDEALLYACRFWSRHLARLSKDGVANQALLGALEKFSATVLLCWIEVLSLFGELESAAVMLREGISWLKTLPDIPKDALILLEDADRLVVFCMVPISQCALQVYLTAISLAPSDSIIYKTFHSQSYGTLVVHPDREGWNIVRTELNLRHLIHSVVFSPNGEAIATAGVNQGVEIWNTVTGGNVASLGDRSSTALLVSYSPTGAFLAAAFEGGTVAVWDPKVGREHLRLEGCHSQPITCIEFSEDNTLLASGSRDHTIQVCSTETAQPLFRLASHEGPVTSLTFSGDSLQLFSGSEDNLIMMWDMSSGKLIRVMTGHRKIVNHIAVSRNGGLVASGSEDKTVKLWDPRTGKCTQTFSKGHHSGVKFVHIFDEDEHVIAVCNEAILSWSVTSPGRKAPDIVWAAEDVFEKSLKAVPAWQAKVLGWAAPKPMLRRLLRSIAEDSPAKQLKVGFATQSPAVVFATQDYDYIFGGPLSVPMNDVPLTSTEGATALAISPDGNWVVSANNQGLFQIIDLTMPRKTWQSLDVAVKSDPLYGSRNVVPSPTGTRFVMESTTQWMLADEKYRVIRKIDMGIMGSMRDDDAVRFKFSSDGSIFFCVVVNLLNEDRSTLRAFDALTGEPQLQFSGLKKVRSFVASTSGEWIACGNESGHVEVFGMTSKQRTSMDTADESPIHALCFSSDAQVLASGSKNGVVRVWDRASGASKATFETSTSMVTALAYRGASTMDGDVQVAIGREDGSICIWSPSHSASHDIVRCDEPEAKKVDLVRFSEDGSQLTSRSENGAVFTWAISFEAGDTDMTHCTLCSSSRQDQNPRDAEKGDGEVASKTKTTPHLRTQSDPEDAVDSLFHTEYRVRKEDGWLVNGDRRVLWLPPSSRPSGKDALWAFGSGLVVLLTPAKRLIFLKWVEGSDHAVARVKGPGRIVVRN